MKKLIVIAFFIPTVAYADLLDVVQYGVKGNPDRYISLEVAGTYNHQMSSNYLLGGGFDGTNQMAQYNDRGLRGMLAIPVNKKATFLVGGNWYTGDYAYDGTKELLSQTGQVKGFGVEAGWRFYIHE